MTACYWAPLSLPKHRTHTNNLCWMFVFYNIFIFFFFFNFYCSHLMENHICNFYIGAFDDLKELERLWEHTHTHTHTFTHIHSTNTENQLTTTVTFTRFLIQHVFIHPVASTRTDSANSKSCCFRRTKLCLDCESIKAAHLIWSVL